jgi:hypothetical protein
VLELGSRASFFPIPDRQFVATDDFRCVDLSEVEVESTFADFLTDSFWIGRIALEGRLIRDRLQSVRSGRLGRMSDLAYFEYATVIPPEGNQREGTPAHYLMEVAIKDPVTHKERGEAELKRMANDFLALALNRGVNPIPGLNAISELDAKKLKKVGLAGIHQDGGYPLSSDIKDQDNSPLRLSTRQN